MPIDTGRLTEDEREELRRALVTYRIDLAHTIRTRSGTRLAVCCKLRRLTVETLLADLGY